MEPVGSRPDATDDPLWVAILLACGVAFAASLLLGVVSGREPWVAVAFMAGGLSAGFAGYGRRWKAWGFNFTTWVRARRSP